MLVCPPRSHTYAVVRAENRGEYAERQQERFRDGRAYTAIWPLGACVPTRTRHHFSQAGGANVSHVKKRIR